MARRWKVTLVVIVAFLMVLGTMVYLSYSSSQASSGLLGYQRKKAASRAVFVDYGAKRVTNLLILLTKFSSMKIEFNFTDKNGRTSMHAMSYTVKGYTSMDDGSEALLVNMRANDTTIGGATDSDNVSVYVDPSTGSIMEVFMDGETWTGSPAQSETDAFTFFTGSEWLRALNSTSVQPQGSPETMSLGGITMLVQGYSGSCSLFDNWNIRVAQVQGTTLVAAMSYSSSAGSVSYRLVSLNQSS